MIMKLTKELIENIRNVSEEERREITKEFRKLTLEEKLELTEGLPTTQERYRKEYDDMSCRIRSLKSRYARNPTDALKREIDSNEKLLFLARGYIERMDARF